MIHETRVIPLDGRPHPGKNVRLEMGDARGHWDGDTLVVETTNFKARSAYRNADPDTLKLTERFTKTSQTRLDWRVTVEDPYACHEGNYAVRNMLSATRAEDKAAESIKP
jgi:hypothetical protein